MLSVWLVFRGGAFCEKFYSREDAVAAMEPGDVLVEGLEK
jgi:hypothetical protein